MGFGPWKFESSSPHHLPLARGALVSQRLAERGSASPACGACSGVLVTARPRRLGFPTPCGARERIACLGCLLGRFGYRSSEAPWFPNALRSEGAHRLPGVLARRQWWASVRASFRDARTGPFRSLGSASLAARPGGDLAARTGSGPREKPRLGPARRRGVSGDRQPREPEADQNSCRGLRNRRRVEDQASGEDLYRGRGQIADEHSADRRGAIPSTQVEAPPPIQKKVKARGAAESHLAEGATNVPSASNSPRTS